MTKNTVVKKGWYYRKAPIIEESNLIGLVISYPTYEVAVIEKLKYLKKNDTWTVKDSYEDTLIASVLWNNNVVEKCPLINLVEVK